MSGDPCDTVHLLLQAESDGELDVAGSAGLASHLGAGEACRTLRDRLGTLSARLHEIPRHEVPDELRKAVRGLTPRRKAPWQWLGRPCRGVRGRAGRHRVCGGVAAVPGERRHRVGPGRCPPAALQLGHLTDVPSSHRHTVKPWFNGRIGISPDMPGLVPQGFPRLGGRMDCVGGHPAAVLIYGRRGHAIDVLVQDGTAAAATQASSAFNVARWTSGGLSYQAVSDLNRDELGEFITLMKT